MLFAPKLQARAAIVAAHGRRTHPAGHGMAATDRVCAATAAWHRKLLRKCTSTQIAVAHAGLLSGAWGPQWRRSVAAG